MKILLPILLALLLSACSNHDFQDLREFVKDSGANLRGRVTPLPEVKPYQPFVYDDYSLTDPFNPRKLEISRGGKLGGLQPDLNRRKEALESFPLDGLRMVGSLQQDNKIYALIKAPDGGLYRVTTGNYLGQNFGKITEVTTTMIKIQELVQDSSGDWTERTSTLQLVD
ncbi:MAG: pilus assembly protein PilP [Burkholderiales bacterium]|nr:pilus assembly protein PilP [Burkholderiales bacterium]